MTIEKRATQWRKIVDLLAVGDRVLGERIGDALSDPKAFVARHAKALALRGVSKPTPRLPLLVLLDGLEAKKRVALIDWKSPAEDVVFALSRLRSPVKVDGRWMKAFDEDALDDLSTERVLQAIAAQIEPTATMVNLDTESDQFAIVLVERSHARALLAATSAVGHGAAVVKPKPLAKPKPAPKRRGGTPGTPMEVWPPCEADEPNTWRYFVHREKLRSLCTRKWESAFEVMEAPAWSTSETTDRRAHTTAEACRRAYVAHYESLQKDGWSQFSAEEHAKELLFHDAARGKASGKTRR